MVYVHEGVGVLLGHQLELVFQSRVVIARDESHVRKRANFLGALTTAFFVALQEIRKLLVVQPLLLLDRHDLLQRRLKVHQVHV